MLIKYSAIRGTNLTHFNIGKVKFNSTSVTAHREIILPNNDINLSITKGAFLGNTDGNVIGEMSATQIALHEVQHNSGIVSTALTGAREINLITSPLAFFTNYLIIEKIVFRIHTAFNGPNSGICRIGTDSNTSYLSSDSDVDLTATGIYEKNIWLKFDSNSFNNDLVGLKLYFPDSATAGALDLFIKFQCGTIVTNI